MLLTASSGRGVPFPALTIALLLLRAIARRAAELLALVYGGRLDLRADRVAHDRDPVRHDGPLLAVPLLDQHGTAALVVLAGDLDRMGEALHAHLVQPLLGEVEVLEAPPHLLAGGRLLVAVAGDGGADRLGRQHRVDDAAVVERRAHLLLLARALALVVDELRDLGV